jgi:hypothetical protein
MYLLHLRLLPLELWIQCPPVNDNTTVSTVTDGMFAQLCLDLNKKVNDPNALLAKFKAARAESTNVYNSTYMYNTFTSITTHHLHNQSFHAMQEINTTVCNNIIGLYVQHSDEVYSNGVQNITNELSFDKAVRLHATSHLLYKQY